MAVKSNYSKNGQDYFRISITIGKDINGKNIRKEFYGKSKKDAESKRDEFLHNLKNGLDMSYKNIFLGQYMKTWLFEVVKQSTKPSTFERYEGIFRNYIVSSPIQSLRMYDIKSIQIQRYYNDLFEKGKSTSCIKNINKLLKSFFNYALHESVILKNPCGAKSITIPKNDQVDEDLDDEINVFTDKEIHLLEKALSKNRLKALYLLALGTGLRQGELLGLKWSDIDFYSNLLKVQRSVKRVTIISADSSREAKIIVQLPKTKESIRTVPIPSKLIILLQEHRHNQEKEKTQNNYLNEDDFIFTTNSGSLIDSRNLIRAYKRVLNNAKIPYRNFHNLRHTYATKLFEADVKLKTVQELLGHSNINITANIYTHITQEKKVDAVEKLNALFTNLLNE